MFCKEVISVSDKLYEVLRKVKISHNPIVQTWKEHLNASIVFKRDPYYYFCDEIKEVEPIE